MASLNAMSATMSGMTALALFVGGLSLFRIARPGADSLQRFTGPALVASLGAAGLMIQLVARQLEFNWFGMTLMSPATALCLMLSGAGLSADGYFPPGVDGRRRLQARGSGAFLACGVALGLTPSLFVMASGLLVAVGELAGLSVPPLQQMPRLPATARDLAFAGGALAGGGALPVLVLLGLLAAIARTDKERLRLAADLAGSEDKLRDFYDTAPCGYYDMDADGRILRINRTALLALGFEPAEVAGSKAIEDLVAPHARKDFLRRIGRLRSSRGGVSAIVDLQRKDGSVMKAAMEFTPVYADDGRLIASRATSFDVGERERTQAQLHRTSSFLDSIIEHLPAMLFIKDARCRCSFPRGLAGDEGSDRTNHGCRRHANLHPRYLRGHHRTDQGQRGPASENS